MKIGTKRCIGTLLGFAVRTKLSQAFISPSINTINSRSNSGMSSNSALDMVRNRGLERREEGATPLRELCVVHVDYGDSMFGVSLLYMFDGIFFVRGSFNHFLVIQISHLFPCNNHCILFELLLCNMILLLIVASTLTTSTINHRRISWRNDPLCQTCRRRKIRR